MSGNGTGMESLPGMETEVLQGKIRELEAKNELLVEEGRRFNFLAEHASEVSWIFDPDSMMFHYVSPSVVKLIGYTPDEILAKPFSEILRDVDRKSFVKLVGMWAADLAAHPEEEVSIENRVVLQCKDGSFLETELACRFYRNPTTGLVEVQGISRDISAKSSSIHLKSAPKSVFRSDYRFQMSIMERMESVIIFSLDRNYCYTAFTKLHRETMHKIWGAEIAVGMNMLVVISNPKDMEKARKNFDRALKGEHFVLLEEYGDDRHYRTYFENYYNPIKDTRGNNIGVSVFVLDVTARMRTEAALKESEMRYRNLFDKANEGLVLLTMDGKLAEVNDAFARMHGYTKEEILMLDINDLDVLREHAYDGRAEVLRRLMDGEVVRFEVEHYHKDGHVVVFSDTASLITIEGIQYFQAFHQDITERRKTEEELKKWNKQFLKLSRNAPGLIFQLSRKADGHFCIPLASEGIRDIYGCSPEDVADDFSPISNVIILEDYRRLVADIEQSFNGLNFFTSEFRVQLPGEPLKWVYSRLSPEKLADGSICWYGFNADITEQKLFEQELIAARKKAEESDQLKSAFLANMSHEIRTPMNGILGFAGLLKEPSLSGAEQQEYIAIIEKSGERMLDIINNIVDISLIEAGVAKIEQKEFNVYGQLQYIFNFFNPEVVSKGLKFSLQEELFDKELVIRSDQEKFLAIVSNLVKNAIKFTTQGGIEFGCLGIHAMPEPSLQFFVRDTGIGIPADRQEAVFERFVQADLSDRSAYQGAGLGLSISKAYVEMLGGSIWVESSTVEEPGIPGTTFYFSIPCHVPTDKKIPALQMTSQPAGTVTTDHLKLKVLIVEDDEMSVLFLRNALKNYYREILFAGTGQGAVEICQDNPDIHLVMMDIKIPGTNGYEATKQIRRFNKEVIIIAQTAFGLSGDKEKALEAGCNDYLSKPISKEQLTRLIQKYFGI